MDEAVIASRKPFYMALKKGRTYWWCSCGRSQKQPFCDGAHNGTRFEPVKYVGQYDGQEVLFCGCKKSGDQPFCDGAHNNLPGAYQEDDPWSAANRVIRLSQERDGPRTFLDDRCYVFSTGQPPMTERGGFRYCATISQRMGAHYQSLFYGELVAGRSPVISLGDVHVILFIAKGQGKVCVSGQDHTVKPGDGVYVRPNEAFAFHNNSAQALQVFISACPAVADLSFLEQMPENFDHGYPQRVVGIDPAKRQAMAARYFQLLVNKDVGSTVVTQFIGHIPKSKAEPHRHLYEEALIILSGEGMMWTESRKSPVQAGDVIFLPAKQKHSLESTNDEGMDVVGVIYPGDNPSINY